jgi:hypothetical protein
MAFPDASLRRRKLPVSIAAANARHRKRNAPRVGERDAAL